MKGKAWQARRKAVRHGISLVVGIWLMGGGVWLQATRSSTAVDWVGAVQGLLAGAPSVAMAQRDEVQTPEELYKQANKQLDRGYYERAVELFERIKTRYPFSQYAVLAELRLGDTQFNKAEYALAVEAYRNFMKLHPRHPELDYVTYRIAESEFRQAPRIAQRDQAPTRRMLAILQGYEERYPESKYTKQVQEMRAEGRTRLAKALFGIAQHYYRRGRFDFNEDSRDKAFAAANERFEQVLGDYPDSAAVAAESFYFIGRMYARQGRKAEAEDTLARLKARYPTSHQVGRLERQLKRVRWPAVPPKPKGTEPAAGAPAGTSETEAPAAGAAPAESVPTESAPTESAPTESAPTESAPAEKAPEAPASSPKP